MKRFAAIAFVVLALTACERAAEDAPAPSPRPEPVVVYASFEEGVYLPSLFADFTRETGIPVTVRRRPEHQIVGEMIANKGAPPADLLLTRSVHGIWRAADEGALRPLQSAQISDVVPAWLRDPDGYWIAIGFSDVRLVCGTERRAYCAAIEAYEDLGKPELDGRLCLSTSSLAVNRTLIAGLIADHGLRPAEVIVRGWVANLALPPFETEAALLQAVDEGTCGLALVSGLALFDYGRSTVAAQRLMPGYFDVIATGVNRHARSPDAARRLAEWLAGAFPQERLSALIGLSPANTTAPPHSFLAPDERHNAALFGLHETDAVKLAERARWY